MFAIFIIIYSSKYVLYVGLRMRPPVVDASPGYGCVPIVDVPIVDAPDCGYVPVVDASDRGCAPRLWMRPRLWTSPRVCNPGLQTHRLLRSRLTEKNCICY